MNVSNFVGFIKNRLKRIAFLKVTVDKIKHCLLYYYVIKSKFSTIKIDMICFFYLPVVPDFGNDFTYIKLGKKEPVENPKRYSIIFEADLPNNISIYNEFFMDYSGLYALYKNNLIKNSYMMLIHYDTNIRHKEWIEIIKAQVRKRNVVYSTWDLNKECSDVSRWIYREIDKVFLAAHKKPFSDYISENTITKLPNSSQFACTKETFEKMMEFLMPIYDFILNEKDKTFKYAHLLERAWGLFFAMEGYKKVGVVYDSHNQARSHPKGVVD